MTDLEITQCPECGVYVDLRAMYEEEQCPECEHEFEGVELVFEDE